MISVYRFVLRLEPDSEKLALFYIGPEGAESKVCEVTGIVDNFKFKIELGELQLAQDGPELKAAGADLKVFFFYERAIALVEELSLRTYQALLSRIISKVEIELKHDTADKAT